MLPANQSSPHLRSRFIELYNAGDVTIPGFAALQVIQSERPEKSGTVTPDGGRTVLRVLLATTDEPCLSIINGPCEIPPGKYGRPGTMDSPMLALVETEYVPNTDVGIQAGSFKLTEGICGWRVVGDYDAGTGTQRVIKTDDCQAGPMVVRATECILPGEGGTVQPQQWNSITECYEDTSGPTIEVVDPMGWLLAVPDDCFKVERQHRCGTPSGGVYTPSFPFGMTQLVRIETQIDCGECGEVAIVRKSESGSGVEVGLCNTEATECTFQACNMSFRPLACDGPEYAIAHIIPGECCLPTLGSGEDRCIAYLIPYPRPMFAKGTLTAKMCGGAPELRDAGPLDVCTAWEGQEITSASNPLGLHACANTDVLLLWCTNCGSELQNQCSWMVIAVEDVELPDYILDLRCASTEDDEPTCAIEKQYKVQKRYGHFCECEDDENDWNYTQLEFNNMTVVESIEATPDESGRFVLTEAGCGTGDASCSLVFDKADLSTSVVKKTTRSICVLCPKEDSGTEETLGTFATIGAEGTPDTINGAEFDVVTELTVKSPVTSEGDPAEVDCETAGEFPLELVAKTRKICVFCGHDGNGNFPRGDEVPLLLKFAPVEAVTEADFYCDPCIGLDVKTTKFYALCVGEESTATSVTCGCYECPPEESS